MKNETSKRNKYWIPKHRYLELKHFCRQYPDWKKQVRTMDPLRSKLISSGASVAWSDPTFAQVEKYLLVNHHIILVEQTVHDTAPDLYNYILEGVTSGASYTSLSTLGRIPCSRDTYYILLRKFYWLLDQRRENFDPYNSKN